jgi:methylene-fatty-acyl-phospholipid synthase
VTLLFVTACAALLSLERLCYVWAWRRPRSFARAGRRWRLGRDPVTALERAFCFFKLVQTAVFAAWCLWFAPDHRPAMSSSDEAILLGGLLVVAGQTLNFSAAWRLGRVGMFYGIRFGHRVPRVDRFPYSVLTHPQYFGTVATIWGLFLALRFPEPDWIVLPLLESTYYLVAAFLESDRVLAAEAPRVAPAQPSAAGPAA